MIQPLIEIPHPIGSGTHKVYRFENGYGASVVSFNHMGARSYGGEDGLWEMGVTEFHGPGNDDWEITYETPVSDDVIGWLSDDDVEAKLAEIRALPAVEVPK